MAAIARSRTGVDREQPEPGQLAVAWRRFRKRRTAVFALVVLGLLIAGIILLPMISPFKYTDSDSLNIYAPMGTPDTLTGNTHWFGTDYLGRDVFTRLFFAARTSILVSVLATLGVVLVGTVIGSLSGFYGGWVDTLFMRLADFLIALPVLPMFLITYRLFRPVAWGSRGPAVQTEDAVAEMTRIALVFIVFGWIGIARLVRGSMLSLRSQPFIEASRALGAGNRRLIFRHLLPNSLAPVLVAATFSLGDFIIWESLLAFFGQGLSDFNVPSMGNILVGGVNFVFTLDNLNPTENIRAYLFILPAALLFITVLSFNYIGEGIRAALDPHRNN